MSATGAAPFFNAPDAPQGDGTQADVPHDTFADPLSGLVTGPALAPGAGGTDNRPVAVPGPVQHDPEVVQRMVAAALQAEQEGTGYQQFQAIPPATSVSTLGEQIAPPLGMLPQQRTWPTRPPQLLRQRRSRQLAEQSEDFDDELELPTKQRRGLPKPSLPSMPRIGKPSANTAGVLLAVALMIVFVIVAIQLLSSLFSGIAGIFGG